MDDAHVHGSVDGEAMDSIKSRVVDTRTLHLLLYQPAPSPCYRSESLPTKIDGGIYFDGLQ